MNAPRVSVIIPVYNVAPYLCGCLDSVLAQTFTDWEAICVDDGSTDGSGAILDKYALRDDRIRVIHQENQGVARARQVALDSCRGEWVGAVDPDDWIDPDYFQIFYDSVRDGDLEMAWCDYWAEGRRIGVEASDDPRRHLESLLADEIWGTLWNRFFRRAAINRFGIRFPPRECDGHEDVVFVCEFLTHATRIKRIDLAGYHYVQRTGSLCHEKQGPDSYGSLVMSTLHLERRFAELSYDAHEAVRFRKEMIKFWMYDKGFVPDGRFLATFPDVVSFKVYSPRPWHRIFFALALKERRRAVIRILGIVRAFLRRIRQGDR